MLSPFRCFVSIAFLRERVARFGAVLLFFSGLASQRRRVLDSISLGQNRSGTCYTQGPVFKVFLPLPGTSSFLNFAEGLFRASDTRNSLGWRISSGREGT